MKILPGTLDLMVLRTLSTLGPLHAYAIAARLQQVSKDALNLNQGTLFPALLRLEQQGRVRGKWARTESGREAKFYAITKAGEKSLRQEAEQWNLMADVMQKLLAEEK